MLFAIQKAPVFAAALIWFGVEVVNCAPSTGPIASPGVVKQWTNSIGMIFVRIGPGKFMMGTPLDESGRYANEKLHQVRITRSYMLGAYEVTRRQFEIFVKATGYKTDAEKAGFALLWLGTWERRSGGSWRDPGFEQTDDHPVVNVSWNDSLAFAQWLSRKETRHYRLPTEAEWEYACRAGTQTAYPWGNNPDGGAGFANAADQSFKRWRIRGMGSASFPIDRTFTWDDGFVYTAPIGSFKPNSWGLYDMIGNALEWCSDYYKEYPASEAKDSTGPPQGARDASRILRGGSWINRPLDIRVGFRHWHVADYQLNLTGFRLALDDLQ